jgi:uncharacterized membrane protein
MDAEFAPAKYFMCVNPKSSRHREMSRRLLILFFVGAGINHFRVPAAYLAIMPPYLPAPLLLVYLSGVAEIIGGLGVWYPPTRRVAGWGLLLLLLAVFPANVQAALYGVPDAALPSWVWWARLPLQGILLWWVYMVCLRDG